MDFQSGVSRRQMLAMFAATGSLAIESNVRGTAAQTGKRIEQYAPELDLVVSRSEPRTPVVPSGLPKGRSGGRKAAICCTATFTITGV
jgi:hypothetical protein